VCRLGETKLFWILCVCCCCFAQEQQAQTAEKGGDVVGSVFAARQDGSLVPVKTTTVLLVRASAAEPITAALDKAKKALSDARARMNSQPEELKRQFEEFVGIASLDALLQLLKPLRDELLPAVPNTNADAVGAFTFAGIPPDNYVLLAIGHAGTTAGLWVANLAIEGGKTQRVTMTAPAIGGPDPDGYLSVDKPDAEIDRSIQLLTGKEKELEALLRKSGESWTSTSTTTPGVSKGEPTSGGPSGQPCPLGYVLVKTAYGSYCDPQAGSAAAYVDCKHLIERLDVYSLPRAPAPVTTSLRCGEQVTILQPGDWTKIKTQAHLEGYVPSTFLVSARPTEDTASRSADYPKVTADWGVDRKIADAKYPVTFKVLVAGQYDNPHSCWAELESSNRVYSVATTSYGSARLLDFCSPLNPGGSVSVRSGHIDRCGISAHEKIMWTLQGMWRCSREAGRQCD
jgi:hypothetical protein